MEAGPWILVSAGEVSGDRIAAPVVTELRCRLPGCRFFGAGGPRLRSVGVEILHDVGALSVTGVTEALGRASAGLHLLADMRRQIRRRRPALGLLVDYPGINLRLAGMLRRRGVPVLYFVAPQRWAWLSSRTRALGGCVDELAVTLPFEARWFRRRGIPATFVGNPVIDLFHPAPGEASDPPTVALLPGARVNEIERLLPPMVESLRLLDRELRPVVAVADARAAELCGRLAPGIPQGSSREVLGAAGVGLCASGSATLEAAVAGVPVVICYRLSAVSAALARWLVRVPYVGLPNLLLGAPLLPELLQEEVSPPRMAHELRRLLAPAINARVREGLRLAVQQLGPPGVAARVAGLGLQLVERTTRRS